MIVVKKRKYLKGKTTNGPTGYMGQGVRIFPNVTIGSNVFVDDNVTIGYPNEGEFETFKADLQSGLHVRIEDYVKSPTVIGDNSIIRSGTVICSGTKTGPYLDCDHGVFVGGKNSIGEDVMIQYKGMIYNNNRIGDEVTISGFVCNSCVIGNKVAMHGSLVHDYDRPVKVIPEPSPIIRSGATVGMHAVVIGKVVIGRNAYVAAGAVVRTNVRSGYLVAGVPAHEKGKWAKKVV